MKTIACSRLARAGALLLLAGAACSDDRPVAERRAELARAGDITVAVAWPWEARKEVQFWQGLSMALDEVNAAGGVRGRKVVLVKQDDGESVNQGRLVAQNIAEDPRVVAVIGHLQSYVTVPASAIYDLSGLVLLSPASTDLELTSKGYGRVFRAIFTDREIGQQMAEFAAARGHRRTAIYYVRSNYGRALADAFEEHAGSQGLTVAARASYDPDKAVGGQSFAAVLQEWKQLDLDAVFLAGEVPLAGHLIAEARKQGLDVPFLGSDAMSSPALISTGGAGVEGTVVASIFHAQEPRAEVQQFTRAFQTRFGAEPDPGAALGYDVLRLLVHAMRQADETTPEAVGRSLHGIRDWKGVTGAFTFNEQGDLVGRRIRKIVVRNGRFEYLAEPDAAVPDTPLAGR